MRYIILFIISIFLIGCKEDKAKFTMSRDKLIAVMTDMRIINNQVKKHLYYKKDSIKNLYKNMLLEIHDITEAELDTNLKIVQRDPSLAYDMEVEIQELLRTYQKAIESNNYDE